MGCSNIFVAVFSKLLLISQYESCGKLLIINCISWVIAFELSIIQFFTCIFRSKASTKAMHTCLSPKFNVMILMSFCSIFIALSTSPTSWWIKYISFKMIIRDSSASLRFLVIVIAWWKAFKDSLYSDVALWVYPILIISGFVRWRFPCVIICIRRASK